MRYFSKASPPDCLTTLRATPGASYAHLSQSGCKQIVREVLVHDQRQLCCYCMERIASSEHQMKIEHWAPQNGARDNDLDWSNLLGACLGNQDGRSQPAGDRHCDTAKGENTISIRPTDGSCDSLVEYKRDGTVFSSAPHVQKDLDETLNLNVKRLRDGRKVALKEYLDKLARQNGGAWPRPILEKELARLREAVPRIPYDGILISYLARKLKP
jgi:uncharacterized protein (TIGR02646 family)